MCASGALTGPACNTTTNQANVNAGSHTAGQFPSDADSGAASIQRNEPVKRDHLPSGPCISIYLPSQLDNGSSNCLILYERTHLLNFINSMVMLKPFSGGGCSLGDYTVKSINGSTYCLESDK
jgi:hypothetical protein